MIDYVIEGLDPAPFQPLFGASEAALRERGAMRMAVTEHAGFPCRITLEEACVGASVILLNHVSREGSTPYRAAHAIFVCEQACAAARFENRLPPVMAARVLSLRGFDEAGMMVDAVLTQPGEAEAGLAHLFANDAVVEVDVHNAVRGCFSARACRL
ncbi:MAG: DUF1203 domain-containing protein [Erythrobacter sp.]|jgi:hypothetical protein|nr:DUF1203 domain-containing protein [Erythrobacter sp.]